MMRVLVTGGTGFIGSHLFNELLRLEYEVIATGRKGENILGCSCIEGDILTIDWDSLGSFDVVFHQVANNDTTCLDEALMMQTNVEASLKLFNSVVRNGCKRIIYASSTAVYGGAQAPYKEDQILEPLNPYGISKKILDEQATIFATNHPDIIIVGLRYSNVYGPGEAYKGSRASMVYQLAQQMLQGNPKIFKCGEQKRDYVYIYDVIRANLSALKASKSSIYNCGSGESISFNGLINILNNVLGLARTLEYVDNPHAKRYQNFTQCDVIKIRNELGFIPSYSITSGIKQYYESGFLTNNSSI